MKKQVLFLFSLILMIAPFLSGCTESEKQSSESGDEFVIYTTVYPLQYFAQQIGDEYVRVETIYPPGVDEHTYEPSQKDIIDMAEGDMFLYIGYDLEGFAEKAKPILEDEGVKTVAVGEAIQLEEQPQTDGTEEHEDEHAHEDEHGDGHHHIIDPHLWVDPVYSKEMAKVILDQLVEEMPDKEEVFTKNYEQLAEKLDQLNDQLTQLATEAKVKEFIVSHAAYGYWEKRYGLKQLSIAGISSAQEPSQKQLEEIIDLVHDYNLEYILVEQNISNKLVDVVKREAGVEALSIHNLSVLTENDIEENRDYFSIMEDNIETLKQALKAE
ncbi:metal ABC transporter solute-binding protein, Zn/Mn family [Fervidibacillus halotolerans]|uniref:Zinc ABC transporter substrate-binding protein n=1 Tax=Fervidibacillus halotolerans TaxID=2980027 RepID=A0A9E8RY31_9BACI|nr:zinc ABC transporter substrate-binding protein [Fervidibacillus halotolerans]WAA11793.1 zinc ABC transporter substrate-binding protein [Fervidibacillus halotolerans]